MAGAQPRQHALRIRFDQGRRGEDDVAQGLGEDPTQAEHDAGPEGGVAHNARDEFTIADIANWPWVRIYEWSGISIDGLDNLKKWIDMMAARPA